jgi:MFS family permease
MALFVEQIGVEGHALATVTGAVIFAAGFPAMLTAPSWARLTRSFSLESVIVASVGLTGLASMAVGFGARHIGQLIVLRVLFGLAMAGFTPLSFQWITTRSPAGMRGRAAGLASTAMMAGNVIGPLLYSRQCRARGLLLCLGCSPRPLALGVLRGRSRQLNEESWARSDRGRTSTAPALLAGSAATPSACRTLSQVVRVGLGVRSEDAHLEAQLALARGHEHLNASEHSPGPAGYRGSGPPPDRRTRCQP